MARKPVVKTLDLADELEAAQPTGPVRNWFKHQTDETKRQLLKLRASYRAGRLNHHSLTAIYKSCKKSLGIRVCEQTFSDWLKREDD